MIYSAVAMRREKNKNDREYQCSKPFSVISEVTKHLAKELEDHVTRV
jgi:hypothetical protein